MWGGGNFAAALAHFIGLLNPMYLHMYVSNKIRQLFFGPKAAQKAHVMKIIITVHDIPPPTTSRPKCFPSVVHVITPARGKFEEGRQPKD